MVWLLIALVVGAVVLTLIFTSSIEEIWLLGYGAFVMVEIFILSIGLPIVNGFDIIPQKVSKTTQTYELKEYSNNTYYVSNTSENSITVLIKDVENGFHEETFKRNKVVFEEADTPKLTVEYQKKKKYKLRDKIWFFAIDGKNDGKKLAEKAVIYLPKESATDTVFCATCGAENNSDAEYCSKCGAKLVKERTCTECGNKLNDGDVFCSKCGKKVE